MEAAKGNITTEKKDNNIASKIENITKNNKRIIKNCSYQFKKNIKNLVIYGVLCAGLISDIGITLYSLQVAYNIS